MEDQNKVIFLFFVHSDMGKVLGSRDPLAIDAILLLLVNNDVALKTGRVLVE